MNTEPRSLHHNLISLPTGKYADDSVSERHDIVLLFDASKANPNGDPDTGNMPRLQPDTLRGLVTDVCLKRKVRNFFSLYNPDASMRSDPPTEGYEIFIRENAVLQQLMESPQIKAIAKDIFTTEYGLTEAQWDGKATKDKKKGKEKKGKQEVESTTDTEQVVALDPAASAVPESAESELGSAVDVKDFRLRAFRDALCRAYFDLRAFGGVTSTEGPLKGSFYGQIRGPLQFSFAESLDRVLQLDATITRCAVASTKEKTGSDGGDSEETGNRTMGRKHLVDYGLYRTQIYFSPAFAAKTHFSYYDLDNFFFALMHMFRDDNAAGRTGMRVVGLVDFQHLSALGNEHAHRLFEQVNAERTDKSIADFGDYPRSLKCYSGSCPEGSVVVAPNNGANAPLVQARKLVWEISECLTTT